MRIYFLIFDPTLGIESVWKVFESKMSENNKQYDGKVYIKVYIKFLH